MARKLIIGSYDTDLTGHMTLTALNLSAATAKTERVSIPGRSGDLDLSFILTDGEPVFNSRTLTAKLETSYGTRANRISVLDAMVNQLEGRMFDIYLPDDSTHYIRGRVHVSVDYNDNAHAGLTVTATCDPWKYATTQRSYSLTASSTSKTQTLVNSGLASVVPTITIAGTNASVTLTFGSKTWSLSRGTYTLPDLSLTPGNNSLGYLGSGSVSITYREVSL